MKITRVSDLSQEGKWRKVAAWCIVMEALRWIWSATDWWLQQTCGLYLVSSVSTNSICSSEVAIPPWTGDCQQKQTPESEDFDKIPVGGNPAPNPPGGVLFQNRSVLKVTSRTDFSKQVKNKNTRDGATIFTFGGASVFSCGYQKGSKWRLNLSL